MSPEQQAQFQATSERRMYLVLRRTGFDEDYPMVMALDDFPEWHRYNGRQWKIETVKSPKRRKVRQ